MGHYTQENFDPQLQQWILVKIWLSIPQLLGFVGILQTQKFTDEAALGLSSVIAFRPATEGSRTSTANRPTTTSLEESGA